MKKIGLLHVLVVLKALALQTDSERNSGTRDHKGATEVPTLDNDYVALPERGMLLERTGTLLTHDSYDITSLVIAVDRPDVGLDTTGCRMQLDPVTAEMSRRINELKSMTDAIFRARQHLSTEEVCTALGYDDCNDETPDHRGKRFIAEILAVASFGLATSAIAMSAVNTARISDLQEHLEQNRDDIQHLKDRLLALDITTDLIIANDRKMVGVMKAHADKITDMQRQITCIQKYIKYKQFWDRAIKDIESALQFVLNGKTHGHLTPSLLTPPELDHIIKRISASRGTNSGMAFFEKFPNIWYQTAHANLIGADFSNLTFEFLITYPHLRKAPIYPFFEVKQVGFIATKEEHQEVAVAATICLKFMTPQFAIYDDGWHFLNAPLSCPLFGTTMVCPRDQYQLIPLEECLSLDNTTASKCPIRTCGRDQFISTRGGVLLRTTDKYITITDKVDLTNTSPLKQNTGKYKEIAVPKHQAAFIEWGDNVASVHFSDTVVYSPRAPKTKLRVTKYGSPERPNITWTELLRVPELGASQINDRFRAQHTTLEELQNFTIPTSAAVMEIQGLLRHNPMSNILNWVKYGIIATGGIATMAFLYTSRKICMKRKAGAKVPEHDENLQNPEILVTRPGSRRTSTITMTDNAGTDNQLRPIQTRQTGRDGTVYVPLYPEVSNDIHMVPN